MDDRSAIQRLKQGDISGLAALVSRYQVEATRTAFLITQDAAAADDIMQAAFLQCYRHIAQYDDRRPFAPYFMRIVVNAALQVARQQQRLVALEDDADFQADDAIPSPESEAEAAELRANIGAALKLLSADQRTVIVMRYYLDLNEREMAQELGCPPGTVSWRLHAARKQLRVLLHQYAIEQREGDQRGR
ncbi:MAG: sigma-70 family RNA polymerase sigma factor [Armatimonadetes bacterium]|nr:sigma-70 family RNA polymerase sigma factor [Anaerolineae bacterium]